MKTSIPKDNTEFKTRTSTQTTELFTPRAMLVVKTNKEAKKQ